MLIHTARDMWLSPEDLLGPVAQWPSDIRKLFWSDNLHKSDLKRIAAFAFGNGLPLCVLVDFCSARKVSPKHIKYLTLMYKKWNDPFVGEIFRAQTK